ncbi:MAG TPA: energy transducer TonB [Fluviicoccus sp.]|nr:energy transducer TonB [Fluviicoccus sp.]
MSTLVMDADTRRLGLSLVIASLLHALVIFGITFVAPPSNPQSMIEVTLALHRDTKADAHADFLAAANQQGAGQSKQALEMTSPQTADFADARIAEVRPEDKASFAPPPEETRHQLVVTRSASRKLPPDQPRKEIPLRQPDDGVLAASAQTAAIASLEARLAEKRQALARKQRIHTVSTLSARADISAAWIDDFRQKVERMGNRHYPEQARQRRLRGEVRLLVAITPGGEVREIRTLQSSGQVLLDEAARRSVQLSAPFKPFSREMRREMDVLQIIRTWRFAEGVTNRSG